MAGKKLSALTITAELTTWRLHDNVVSGTVRNSKCSEFPEGSFRLVDVEYITHYEAMTEPEQWLIRSRTGKYFRIFKGEEWNSKK